jgi:hypothetical protein
MNNRPVGVTIISILTILLGIWSLCGGLIAFGAFSISILDSLFGLGNPVGFGLFGVLWGIIAIILGWGLWNMRNWAWLGTIIILSLRLISFVVALIGPGSPDWIGVLISVLLILYLATPRVRASFAN